ncbi:unnamed protein product [Closterium sp. NIES-54]
MHRRVLVSGLPRVLPPLPPSPAPPCLPCVEGRQRAAPHSSSFSPTEAPLQTLHLDVWGPARVHGQGHERYFLLVVDDYTRYTTVFPLRTKGEVPDVLIPWIHAARLQLRERFGTEFPVLRLHSDRGGEFSSDLLATFCAEHGIRETFTLPASPQQNGVVERRIGLFMEVARTSMIHAAAPHFLWPFAVRYAAHELNLWPRVSLPETSPTLLWTGKVGDVSHFRVLGARAFFRDTIADKLSARAVPCVFLGFVPDARFPFTVSSPTALPLSPPPPLFLAPGAPQVDPLPAPGPAPSGVSQVDPPPLTAPVEVTSDSSPTEGGPARGAASRGAEPEGAEPGGIEPGGAAPRGAKASGEQSPWSGHLRSRSAGTSLLHSRRRLPLSPQQLREWYVGRQGRTAGARGPAAGGAGAGDSATGVVSAGGSGAAEGAGARGSRAAEGAGAGGFGAAAGAGTEGSKSAVARSPWSSRFRPRVPLTSQQLHDWYGRCQGRASGARGSAAGGKSADVTGAGSGAGPGGARTGGTGAAGAGGAELEGAAAGDTEAGDPGTGGAGYGGAAAGGAGPGGAGAEGSGAAGGAGAAKGAGAAGAGSTAQPCLFFAPPSPSSQPPSDSVLHHVLSLPLSTGLPLQPGSPLHAPSPYTEQTGGLTERREPASRPVLPVHSGRSGHCVPRLCQPAVPGTHLVVRRPSSPPQSVLLPSPPASSLPTIPEPEFDRAHAAHPTVTRLLATVVTDPSFESTAASALVAHLVDFVAACRLDYAASLIAESESVCPPSVGDPDAPDIPTPRSYAEAIMGQYSSQWQTAMDAEMASWKSTGTYIDEVPPPGANIVSGMWIFRVKRPPGSPPVFKARYIARGFSQREGVDFFQTFSPTPKMTTLRVLLHVAAQRDYELHSLDFSTAFLQGSLHKEIWLRRPPGFTGSFPPGTQWSLRWPVYGLRQAPREWHDTLRTALAALGFAPSTTDPSLFLRTDTSLPPFYILVYVDDLVFATADTEALALVKSELQKRHNCTDLEPSGPYPELVGCLMYLMICTRPDLAYPLGLLARYVAPSWHRKVHMDAAKRVLRYLCSTSGMGLVLGGQGDVVLTGHSDTSWVDDQATQRSSQGYTFSLGSGSFSWRSTCSSSVLNSSCEAEIYATAMAAQELRWLTYLLTDLGERPRSPPVLYVDNKAAIALC